MSGWSVTPEGQETRRRRFLRLLVALIVTVLLSGVLFGIASAAPRQGFAAHYRKGLMQRVARVRGLPDTGCLIASPFHTIGDHAVVTSTRGSLNCLVVDVPHPRDRPSIIRRGIVAELDFESARLLCGIRFAGQEPPRNCPVSVREVR